MALISGTKSKCFRGIGFFPQAAQTLVCSWLSSRHPWEALLQKGPDFSTRVLNCASTSFQEQGGQLCSRIWQTTWRDLSGKFSASNLPNFSVRVSCVRLWETFIFLQSLCLLLAPEEIHILKNDKNIVLLPHLSTKAQSPFSSHSESVFSTGSPQRVTASDKIYIFLSKGPFWTWASLNARGKKIPISSWKNKNWILFKIAKLRKLFAD